MQISARKRMGARVSFGAFLAVILLLVVTSGCVPTSKIDTSAMSFSSDPLVGNIAGGNAFAQRMHG
jgi:hypothetical protein